MGGWVYPLGKSRRRLLAEGGKGGRHLSPQAARTPEVRLLASTTFDSRWLAGLSRALRFVSVLFWTLWPGMLTQVEQRIPNKLFVGEAPRRQRDKRRESG